MISYNIKLIFYTKEKLMKLLVIVNHIINYCYHQSTLISTISKFFVNVQLFIRDYKIN